MKRVTKVILAAWLIMLFAAPAMAATQWNFGASLMYKTFWTTRDGGDRTVDDLEGGGRASDSDGKLDWGLQSDSLISAEMKSEHLQGYLELNYDFDESQVKTNYFWGSYNFTEDFSILIGQTDVPFKQEISNQVYDDNVNLNGIGTASADTRPLIALQYKGFTFAMAKPETNMPGMLDTVNAELVENWYFNGNPVDTFLYDKDTYLPQLHAGYEYLGDTWRIKLAGAFATTKIKKAQITSTGGDVMHIGDKTLTSWLVGLDGSIDFGPLYLAAAASYGANWNLAGWNDNELSLSFPMLKPNAALTSTKIEDTYSLMLALVAGYQLTEALRFEAGGGWRHDDNNVYDGANNSWSIYLQAAYAVAPGFEIIPEIGYMNFGDQTGAKWNANRDKADKSEGYLWYAGMQWKMDF